jgi:hypothetical protein
MPITSQKRIEVLTKTIYYNKGIIDSILHKKIDMAIQLKIKEYSSIINRYRIIEYSTKKFNFK